MSASVFIRPNTVKEKTYFYDNPKDNFQYNLLCIGRYSYMGGVEVDTLPNAVIMNTIEHNLQIGQFCSIAPGVKFLTSRNHNYRAVATGDIELLKGVETKFNGFKQKASIIVQNDVWIGRDSTIMPGIVIRNGAVIAANSHVVSDVPPYAVVGGNPARIIGYRFEKDIIDKLLEIRWWDWSDEKIEEHKNIFALGIDKFCDCFYDEAIKEKCNLDIDKRVGQYLYIMDFEDLHPCYPFMLDQFIEKFANATEKSKLILYVAKEDRERYREYIQEVEQIVHITSSEEKIGFTIELEKGNRELEELVAQSEYYITNRHKETILVSEYADRYNTKLISGVEHNMFEDAIGIIRMSAVKE